MGSIRIYCQQMRCFKFIAKVESFLNNLGRLNGVNWMNMMVKLEHLPFQRREKLLRERLHKAWSIGSEHSHRIRNCPPVKEQ